MATKPLRAIACEGKDDFAVFRALLLVEEARKKKVTSASPENGHMERYDCEHIELLLVERNGKSRLAEIVLDVAEGSAATRAETVLVSFDPDDDPAHRELAFFERDFEKLRQRRAGQLTRTGGGRLSFRAGNRDVTVLPAPWRSSTPSCFAGLPEEHCIERLLIEALLTITPQPPALTEWATDAMKKLHALVHDKGHKRAFRLWSAALDPDSESFVARLFQMHETRGACLDAVRATPAFEALRTLLDG